MNIGADLKRLRKLNNKTLVEVENATSIPIATLSDYERNRTIPSLQRFFILINYYGVLPEVYFAGREVIDITDYSYVGKEKAYALHKEELSKIKK